MINEAVCMNRDYEQSSTKKPDVVYFFSAHTTPEDFSGLKETLDQADIYVTESHGWTPEQIRRLQEISNGTEVPSHQKEGRPPKTASEYEDELLYDSKIKIETIDVPEDHELDIEKDGTEEYYYIVHRFIGYGHVDNELQNFVNVAKKNADYLNKKDALLEENLSELLERVKKEYKKMPRIVIQLGSMHINFSHPFLRKSIGKRANNTVEYHYVDELVRNYRIHREPKHALVVRAFALEIIRTLCYEELSSVPHLKRNQYFRSILQNLDQSVLEKIGLITSNEYYQRQDYDNTPEEDDKLKKSIFLEAWKKVLGVDVLADLQKLTST